MIVRLPCGGQLFYDSNSKISHFIVAFYFGSGPQKVLIVTLKSAHKNFQHVLKFTQGDNGFFNFLTAKKRENQIFFYVVQVKNHFAHYGV